MNLLPRSVGDGQAHQATAWRKTQGMGRSLAVWTRTTGVDVRSGPLVRAEGLFSSLTLCGGLLIDKDAG